MTSTRRRRHFIVALLLAAVGVAAPLATAAAEGQGTAIQVDGACSDVTVRADGLQPDSAVLLIMNRSGQHGAAEVPSSRRVVNGSGTATWRVPHYALPDGDNCSRFSQLTFSVHLVRADTKLGQRVAGPIDLQGGPSPSVVGQGALEDPASDTYGTATRVLLLLGVLGGAVAVRAGVVRIRPRSRP